MSIGGTADATLYGTFTGSPNSAGWITEIAYLPFSYGGPSFWPWLNMRIGLQYTLWNKFEAPPPISTARAGTRTTTTRFSPTPGSCSDRREAGRDGAPSRSQGYCSRDDFAVLPENRSPIQ
jgi:hypothetical protein